jgi:hypothetical protein
MLMVLWQSSSEMLFEHTGSGREEEVKGAGVDVLVQGHLDKWKMHDNNLTLLYKLV